MNRLEKKNDLQFKLGVLFGPLLRIASHPTQYDEQEIAESVARYCHEYTHYFDEIRRFCEEQPGHNYRVQHTRMWLALQSVMTDITNFGDISVIAPKRANEARAALDAIPIPRESVILEAGSPFTAYCKIRDLCETEATSELAVVDPYVDDSIFHRFLRHVRTDVPIILVTSDLKPSAGTKDQRRHNDFLDVSRLFAQERDPGLYRIVLQPASVLHDRWMRFDNKRLVSLGGSSKDAGDRQWFTVAHLDATAANLSAFQNHIDTGTEHYGPSTPTHR